MYLSCHAQCHHLTWLCHWCRDSMQTFEELSDIFSDHNNYLTSRELLMRVSLSISYLRLLWNLTVRCGICKNPSDEVCRWNLHRSEVETFLHPVFRNSRTKAVFCLPSRKALQSLPVWRIVPRSTRSAHTRDCSCRRKWWGGLSKRAKA